MNKIILVGAGGHAKSCIDVIEMAGKYSIAGVVDKPGLDAENLMGYKIIGNDDDLASLFHSFKNALVTVGQIKSPSVRKRLFDHLISIGFNLPVIKSPTSYISKTATVGEGTIVMHGAVINTAAKLGHNCIINNKALVEHDSFIGNHCHISTAAVVNGGVEIGKGTFIGSGVIIHNGIKVGSDCVVSAGAIVRKSVPDGSVVRLWPRP